MNSKEAENPGTGGGLRYLTEEVVPRMVNQEKSNSCQVACARQLLIDAEIQVPEQDLLAKIGYLEGWGTTAEDTARVLDELHPRLGYEGGSVDPDAAIILCKREPWIASVKTDHGTVHAVIVDRLDGEVLYVRDPWGLSGPGSGTGTQATIRLSDFMEHWHWALNNAVIPNRLK